MKDKINEHDFTKKMMSIIRGGYKDKLINEEEDKDTLSPQPDDAVFKDELSKLQDVVDPRVNITNFKIYTVDQNVIIEGTFLQQESKDSGINFRMSLAKGDVETTMNNIELSDKVSLLLQKLKGYYQNWSDEWALKLSREYKPKEN